MKRCILTILACFLSSSASAQQIDLFICASGSWSDVSCWCQATTSGEGAHTGTQPDSAPPSCPSGLPEAGEDVVLGTLLGAVDFDMSASVGTMTVNGMGPDVAVFSQAANDLAATVETVEFYSQYTQTGGTNTVSTSSSTGELDILGNYELDQGGSITADIETLAVLPNPPPGGGNSPGAFKQTGGTNTVTTLQMGTAYSFPAGGTYTLTGGNLSAHYEFIGANGNSGEFDQSGGTNKITSTGSGSASGQLMLGRDADSMGLYYLNSGNLSAGTEVVAQNGMGIIAQSGGQNTVKKLIVGQSSGGVGGHYQLNQGTLKANGLVVGAAGVGTFIQTGGTAQVNGDLQVGQSSDGHGQYSLNGSGKLTVTGNEIVGPSEHSWFFQYLGTTNTVSQTLTIESEASVPGVNGYYRRGGMLVANSIVNNGFFEYQGGVIIADVTNNNIFWVEELDGPAAGSVLIIEGNFTNYGSIDCPNSIFGRPTMLRVSGTYSNHGQDNGCVE